MPDAAQSRTANAKCKPGAIQARFGGFCWIRLGLIWLSWAGLVSPTKRSKAGFIPARLALLLVCSGIRSQFKARKTPPSHGLTDFAAIEVVAGNAGLRRAGGGCETGCWAAVMQGAPGEMPPPCKRPVKPGLRAALMPDAAQSRAADAKRKAGAARMRMFPLSFRERIQGPQNAPIARLDGLCCYRSGSEKRWLAAGRRGGCKNRRAGRRDARHTDEMPPPCKRPVKPGGGRRSCRMPPKAGRQTQNARRAQFKPDSAGFAGFSWA